jgi:hypothetical protein
LALLPERASDAVYREDRAFFVAMLPSQICVYISLGCRVLRLANSGL